MSTVLLRSLPGFTFETVTAPLEEALPRMDVAAFVGFAASGPVNVPVAIEQAAEFDGIFGPDVMLAWDLARGEPAYAHLGPAVRAFFRNGGRRCWVIRVASSPVANTFPLRDLLAWSADRGDVRPAAARARAEGSWSDRLETATVVRRTALAFTSASPAGQGLELLLPSAGSLERKDLLRLTFSADRHRAFGVVDAITLLPSGNALLRLGPVLWFSDPPRPVTFLGTASPYVTMPAPTLVEVLHLDLLARMGGGEPQRAERLGLVSGHPRFWGALPDDAAFFTPWADPMAHGLPVDRRPAITPRFPLAGSAEAADITVPIVDSAVPEYAGRAAAAGSAAQRDGLVAFDPSLFLDPRLRDVGMQALMGQAESLKYQSARTPQLLTGIHAAMFIEEATVIAVPDAVHAAWTILEDTAAPPSGTLPAEPPPVDPCAPGGPFELCEPGRLPAPAFHVPALGDSIHLAWDPVAGATRYTLEEAGAPAFDSWHELATTPHTAFDVYNRPPGQYAFRVRAASAAQASLASEGRTVTIPFRPRALTGLEPYDSRGLLEVQRALLRLCGSRADMVAVLALPESYREADALPHVRALTAGAIEPALSYGTLYHPWIVTSEGADGTLRRMPPDGAASGVLARRTLARGAWVAPANEPLRGVVALTPALRRDAPSRRELLTAQLNILSHEPAGFLTLNADTLSRDPDLRPLNVRRLLILLRRRALQVGSRYVFEPNGPAFARLVQRGFEEMLGRLYERGAFAGRTASTSYQVVVDEAINTPRSRDAGRFFVELRVAPSRSLTFLRVRLLQHGDRLSATEER